MYSNIEEIVMNMITIINNELILCSETVYCMVWSNRVLGVCGKRRELVKILGYLSLVLEIEFFFADSKTAKK